MVILVEQKDPGQMRGPIGFSSSQDRLDYVRGPEVFWFHFVEEDDWYSWHRGGAWQATAPEDPQDRKVVPPEITEQDRW